MKKYTLLLFIIYFIFSTNRINANVLTLCNQTGISAKYTKFTDAYSAAADGDTIYLYGSTISYGGLVISKKITLIGPGYFLDKNDNTSYMKSSAAVDSVIINSTSAGSSIMGLYVNSRVVLSSPNVTVSGNYIGKQLYLSGNCAGSVIKQNYINFYSYIITIGSRPYIVNDPGILSPSISNVYILNNIVSSIKLSNGGSNIIDSNTFFAFCGRYDGVYKYPVSGNSDTVLIASNSIINNNVFYGVNSIIIPTGGLNNTLTNNSNILTPPTSGTMDGKYNVSATSGAFSGSSPYILSGLPPLPIVTNAEIPVSSNTGILPVRIEAKVNQ